MTGWEQEFLRRQTMAEQPAGRIVTKDELIGKLTERVQALEHECGDLQRKNDAQAKMVKSMTEQLKDDDRQWSLANQRLESMTALSKRQAEAIAALEQQVAELSAAAADMAALNHRLTQPVWQQDEELLETTRKQLAAEWEPPLAEAARNCLASLSARRRTESILQGYDGVPCPRCGELKTVSSTEANRWVCEGYKAEGKMVPTERPASDSMTRAEVRAELELMGVDVGAAVDRVLTAVTAAEVRSTAHHPNKAEGLIDLERE